MDQTTYLEIYQSEGFCGVVCCCTDVGYL